MKAKLLAVLLLPIAAHAQSNGSMDRTAVDRLVADWPNRPQLAAQQMMVKYGAPREATQEQLIWHNAGPYKRITLTRKETPHDFPKPHMDFLEHTINYAVPPAQCDIEPNNFLALNLAHDVITGKRSWSEARDFFAKTAMAYKNGDRSSPYMSGLIFSTEPNGADTDMPHKM